MRSRLTGIATVLALTGAFVLTGCKEEGSAKTADEAADAVEAADKEIEERRESKPLDTDG